MHRLVRLAVSALILLSATAASSAPQPKELALEGEFAQGGLVVGQATAGSVVKLDGNLVNIGKGGRFIFGFGRDAAPKARLEVTFPDGGKKSHKFTMKPGAKVRWAAGR